MSGDEFNDAPENLPTNGILPPIPPKPDGAEPTTSIDPQSPQPRRRGRPRKAKPNPENGAEPQRQKKPNGEAPQQDDSGHPSTEELDADEEEYRRLRRDLPHVAGAAVAGIIALGVAKTPDKNDFFRTKKGFCPIFDMVTVAAGMEHKFFAVTEAMVQSLETIGIKTAPHVLYLTITTQGTLRVIPSRCADEAGDRNEYSSTKETGLLRGVDEWVRIYTDVKQGNYRVYPAPKDRFPEPVWPPLSEAKVFRLAFRDRGCLIDSVEHPRFVAWAATFQKAQKS
jgi:hypothetical protein